MAEEMFRLDERVALVTGAGSGLGRQFAMTLARAGAMVALAARNRPKLDETARRIAAIGGVAEVFELDVTDSVSVAGCLRDVEARCGVPDVLVNNAGIARTAFLTDITEADWDAVVDTNLKGVFLVAQACARAMKRTGKGGSIVNVASVLGLGVGKTVGSYVAAKAGVVQLTKAMALEWSRWNIRVNALAPGYFVTDINREQFESGRQHEYVASRVPMGRVGEMPEIAGPLLLLASDAGSYMTGSIVAVDGGHLCMGL